MFGGKYGTFLNLYFLKICTSVRLSSIHRTVLVLFAMKFVKFLKYLLDLEGEFVQVYLNKWNYIRLSLAKMDAKKSLMKNS